MDPDPAQVAREVLAYCQSQGFALVGVCKPGPTDHAAALDAWFAAGKHADMDWLAKDAETRKDPSRELPGVRSIIMVADRYADGAPDPPPPHGVPFGRIARYARGRDYHWFIKRRLHVLNDSLRERFPHHHFRSFVDTAPVLEREHAARAGLGWIGKHTLLIHPRAGSYLLLGGTLTTLDIAEFTSQPQANQAPPAFQAHDESVSRGASPPPSASPHPLLRRGSPQPAFIPADASTPLPQLQPIPDHCGTCTRCIDACPTKAITPYSVDASRCISYLTIETQKSIDPALAPHTRDWIFGCDICQEVCPHNAPRPAPDSPPVHPAYGSPRTGFNLLDILAWTEDTKRAALQGTAMKRASLEMLKRNARNALNLQSPQPGAPATG